MAQVRVRRSDFAVPLAAGTDAVASPGAGDVTITASSTASESPRARFALGAGLFVIASAVVAVVLDNAKVLRDPLKLGADVRRQPGEGRVESARAEADAVARRRHDRVAVPLTGAQREQDQGRG
jgi:hypothetical protein